MLLPYPTTIPAILNSSSSRTDGVVFFIQGNQRNAVFVLAQLFAIALVVQGAKHNIAVVGILCSLDPNGLPIHKARLHTVTSDADTELRLGGYGFIHFGHLLGVIIHH